MTARWFLRCSIPPVAVLSALLATEAARGQLTPDPPRLAWAALGVDVDVEVRRFDVSGRTLEQVRGKLSEEGPLAEDGTRGHGLTDYRLEVEWAPERTAGGCRAGAARVRARVIIHVPRWVNEERASERDAVAWRSTARELLEHERAHLREALAWAYRLERRLVAHPESPDCAKLSLRVQVVLRQIQEGLAEAQDRLDAAAPGTGRSLPPP